MNIDHNKTECLVKKTGFLETEVHNICTNAVHSVAHGGFDILAYVAVIALLFGFVALMITFVVAIFRDM